MARTAKRANSRRSSGKRLTHSQRKQRRKRIAAAVKQGRTLAQVAGQFGVCLATIKDACREHGVSW